MNYGEVKATFLGILNRKDITPTLTETFISFGIQRAQRVLRVPAMENIATYTVDETWARYIPIPDDYLRMVSLKTDASGNDPTELRRGSLQVAMKASTYPGIPSVYARDGGNFVIGPAPEAGTVLYLTYIANFDNLVADTDSNWLTDVCPDVVIYGALSRAADYYLDDRKGLFEETFAVSVNELNEQALEEESVGMAMRPAYFIDGDM